MSGRRLVWALMVAVCPRLAAALQTTTLELRLVRTSDTVSISPADIKGHLHCARGGASGEVLLTFKAVRCVVPSSSHGRVEVSVERASGFYPETIEAHRRGSVWEVELTPRFELLGQIFLDNALLKTEARVTCRFQSPDPDSTSTVVIGGQYRCRDPGSARGALAEVSVAVSQMLARSFHEQVEPPLPCDGQPGGDRCILRRTFDVFLKLK